MWQFQFIAFLKYLASFFKRDWELADYPIRMKRQDANTPSIGHFTLVPWYAAIVNWWQMAGYGNTKEEALSNLKQHLDEYKRQHGVAPRPGTRVQLQWAPTCEIEKHVPIARDFFHRILGMDFDACFVTDRSSLWDFPDTEDEAVAFAKIKQAYGTDVSDIRSGNLAEIFSRLEEHTQGQS